MFVGAKIIIKIGKKAFDLLAQSVEQRPFKAWVLRSNRRQVTRFKLNIYFDLLAQSVEQRPFKAWVLRSNRRQVTFKSMVFPCFFCFILPDNFIFTKNKNECS